MDVPSFLQMWDTTDEKQQNIKLLRGLAITRPGYRGCVTTFTAQKMDFTKANSTLEEKRDWPSRDGFSS